MDDLFIVLDDTEYWRWLPCILSYDYFFKIYGINVEPVDGEQFNLKIKFLDGAELVDLCLTCADLDDCVTTAVEFDFRVIFQKVVTRKSLTQFIEDEIEEEDGEYQLAVAAHQAAREIGWLPHDTPCPTERREKVYISVQNAARIMNVKTYTIRSLVDKDPTFPRPIEVGRDKMMFRPDDIIAFNESIRH